MNGLFVKIKNILPYLLLIVIYFLFVNIEAKKGQNNIQNNKNNSEERNFNSLNNGKNQSISIPVIPYKQ